MTYTFSAKVTEDFSCNVVRDLVPLLHYLRSLGCDLECEGTSDSQSEEEEVEFILHQLQLPTSELERLLADAGFSYDDLELVKCIRHHCMRKDMLVPSEEDTSFSLPSSSLPAKTTDKRRLGEEHQQLLLQQQEEEARGGAGRHRALEALKLVRGDITARVTTSTADLTAADLLLVASPSSQQAHKKCKSSHGSPAL